MPPKPFRVVGLGTKTARSRTSVVGASAAASPASQEKMRLLTYKMALAQPNATVPLLANAFKSGRALPTAAGTGSASAGAAHAVDINRRWVRDADELCVASIRRSSNINKINTYVATYKFDDPHWRPFLLPDVHVVRSPTAEAVDKERESDGGGEREAVPPASTPPSSSSSPPLFDVFIDYDKLLNIELISRHANFALRHLVQKGHAMYFVNYSQHSVLEMRGLVEASYITCAYGIKGERLRTHLLHIGPLDVRDVVEMDPKTGRVTFDLKKGVRKGVVAVSLVEGYGTWFQRKPMLWQRTRRIGALQSQMGAFDYQLCPSELVGKLDEHEVALLEPHVRLMGASGGAEAVGIIASSQVAQNPKLYVGQFEAPVITALDAARQLAHRVALHSRLVRPASDAADGARATQNKEERERRRLLAMERLLPVSWVTRTPPPYVPLEADLPFRLQLSKPAVFHAEHRRDRPDAARGGGKEGGAEASSSSSVVYPTGGTVGSPMVKGVPLSLFEYNLHQGVDHYIFDDAPSARPTKWWSQKSNMPYNGYMYCMRSGLLDYVVPAEAFTNPLAPPSSAAHRRSSSLSQRWKRERRRRRRQRRETKRAERPDSNAQQDEVGDEKLPLESTSEEWQQGQADLAGHDAASRAAEDALLLQEEQQRHVAQRRPPLADMVPPTEQAAERAARYERNLKLTKEGEENSGQHEAAKADGRPSTETGPTVARTATDALLRRQLRQRALKRRKRMSMKGAQGPAVGQEGVKE